MVAESVAPRSLQNDVRSFGETARDPVGSAHLEIRAVQGVGFEKAIESACHCERAIAVSGLRCDEATNLAEPALDDETSANPTIRLSRSMRYVVVSGLSKRE